MEHYEKLYVEESGDKKPEIANYDWLERFSLWLCKRLEKAEKENKGIKDLIKQGNIEVLQDLYGVMPF